MKERASGQKAPSSAVQESNLGAPAGAKGVALAPPTAGTGMFDQQPLQLMADVQTPNRTGLPDQLKAGVERLSGLAMDDVRVHYNSAKPAQLQAFAYTQGTEIHVAPGQERHLPHEAWHVVQQKQGRVRATAQLKNGLINDDKALENEADSMGTKAGTIPRVKQDLQPGAKVFVIQRTYKRATGLYDGRPDSPDAFYPGPAGTQKAHKVPWDWIKQQLNAALTHRSMALFQKLVAFSGKPFPFPANFAADLALAPAARSADFGRTINALAKQVCWTEWNIGRTPLPEHRLAAAGGDDPGNDGMDLNYTSSGHTTPRSFEAEDVEIRGGISALDPAALTLALNNLKNKSGAVENKDAVIPHDPAKWHLKGTRLTNAGGNLPVYANKNNPANWDGPFTEIKYPRENETITSDKYTLRIKVNNKTNNVLIKIQKAGTDGEWVQARKDGNAWWFDWNNIEKGRYEILAKAFDAIGNNWVSRKVTITKT